MLAYFLAEAPGATRKGRKTPAGRIEAREAPLRVDDRQAPAEMNRRRVDDATGLDEGQFRGAATDIDIEKQRTTIVRHLGRTGTIRSEHRLHVVPGRRAHEFTAHVREDVGDGLGVLAAQRLAGEDNRAGVHIVRMDAGRPVGGVDDAPDGLIVDALLALVRSQRDRRLVQGLAAHHEIPAGELLREPPELHAREDHLRARGADIDPDRHERDVVLQPQAGRGRIALTSKIVVVVIVVRLPVLV